MTVLTESFNGDNKPGVGYDHTWTEFLNAQWENNTNRAMNNGVGNSSGVRCDSTLASVDHYVQAEMATRTTTHYQYTGVICRKDNTTTQTWYEFRIAIGDGTSGYNLQKLVDGESTSLDEDTTDVINGTVLKVEADGASIKGYIGGVESCADPDDSSITTGTYGGFHGYQTNTEASHWDSWEAGDLAAGGKASKNTRAFPLGVRAGMGFGMGG